MSIRPLRIVALAAAVACSVVASSMAQQTYSRDGNPQAAPGLDQFQMSAPAQPTAAGYAMPASYAMQASPPAAAPETLYEGQYPGAPMVDPYGPTFQGSYEPYGPPGPSAPLPDDAWCPIYPHGCCYIYTRAEAFILKRDMESDQPFTSRGVGGPIALSADDLDMEFEAGIRGVAGVPLCDCLVLEASYFGLHEWGDTAAATDIGGNLFSVYTGFGMNIGTVPNFIINGQDVFAFFDASRKQAISFESELHNAELNLMYRVPLRCKKQELWLFSGARYIKLQERLQYTTESVLTAGVQPIRSSLTDVLTDNDMVGGQLGGILHHQISKKWRVSLDGKTGMMVNYTKADTFVQTNLFPLGGERVVDESIALVTDAGANLTFDVNCWFSITGGYRFMYIDGVALAPDNFNPVLPMSGLRQPFLNDNGNILLHGAHLGGEIRW